MTIKVWGTHCYISRDCKATKANHYSNTEYFQGYDEMGTACWGELDLNNDMDLESAKATLADLQAAED